MDFLVANDTAPNNLYRNKGDGTFEDVAVEAGVAVDEAGRARGAMGAAWGDTKNGKGATLAIGNFSNELKSLYWTETGEVFLDESPRSGVGPTSLLSLTFGLFFFDADLDGRLDLLLANGHVEPTIQQVQKDVAYKEAPILYMNRGNDSFAVATAEGLGVPLVGRGAAYADLDGDGDLDVVVVENGGPARVFVNRLDRPQQSVRVRLVGTGKSNRDAIGARVTATVGGRTLTQQVSGGQSYLSAPEKTLTFGLGRREDRHARDPLARRNGRDASRSAGRYAGRNHAGRGPSLSNGPRIARRKKMSTSHDDLGNGEGKVLYDQQVALSRDAQGTLHAVSSVCTHMGCDVDWNGEAKTWDCPCHGSRFSPTGEVLRGPASVPLPPAEIPE